MDPPAEDVGGPIDAPNIADTAVDGPSGWLRTVVLFLTGQSLVLFGSAVFAYAVMWYITLKTGSGSQYALMFIASGLATAVTTIPGGVWADRYPRKRLMIGADLAVALCTLILAIVMLAGYERLWLIVLLLALRGFGAGVASPAVSSTIPQLVPAAKLLRVNAVNSSVQALIYLAAPALAAALLVALQLGDILLVDVTMGVIGICCVLIVKIPHVAPETPAPEGLRGYIAHVGEAARSAFTTPGLRRLAVLMAVGLMIVIQPAQMTPVLVVRMFGAEQWKLAAVEMSWSAGTVIGGVILAAWGGLRNRMTLIVISLALWSVFTVGMGLAPSLWVFLGLMIVFGLVVPGFESAALTSVQENVPPQMLGRTMGFVHLIITVATPIGMAVVGPLADVMNVRALTIICGVIGLVIIGVFALDRGPASKLYAPVAPAEPVDS